MNTSRWNPAWKAASKDKELREETCKRRNTGQREQRQGHDKRHLGVGLVEACIIFQGEFMAAQGYDGDDGKDTEVGYGIHQYVVDKGGHALGRSVHDTQHDVSGLRDTGEGHQSLQVLLANGKEVGNGDGSDGDPIEHFLPVAR